jgi:uncharacterized surface anchored protein
MPGVLVTLRDSGGNVVATTTTNSSGDYLFTNIPAGTYSLVQTQPTGYGSSTSNVIKMTMCAEHFCRLQATCKNILFDGGSI